MTLLAEQLLATRIPFAGKSAPKGASSRQKTVAREASACGAAFCFYAAAATFRRGHWTANRVNTGMRLFDMLLEM